MNTPDKIPSNVRLASTVALLYAAFGAVWILLSDAVLGSMLHDRDLILLISTIKGWLFVFLSALLVFFAAKGFAQGQVGAGSARSWHAQTPWAALGIITLSIIGVIGASVMHIWRQEHAQLARVMQTSAVGMAERLADWHQAQINTAQQVQHRPVIAERWRAYVSNPTPAQLASIKGPLETYLSSPHVLTVELLDHRLERIWTSGPGVPERHPPGMATTFRQALARASAMATSPWHDHKGQVRLTYVGLIDPASPSTGLVVLHLDPTAHFQKVLHQWHAIEPSGQARWGLDLPEARPVWLAAPATALPIPPSRLIEWPTTVKDTDWQIVLQADKRALWAAVLPQAGLFALAGLLAVFSAFAVAHLWLQRRALAAREHDLAEVQRSREELEHSESRYRLLAENARDVVWLLDLASQRLIYTSPSVRPLTGFTPDEMCQMALDEILEPDDAARAQAWLQDHVQRFNRGEVAAGTDVLELVHRHKHGAPVSMEVSVQLIADAQGLAVQAQGVSRDLTERKQAEHQIRMLSQATSQSPVAVLITSPEAMIEYVNPAFERMSGFRADEVVGRNPRLLQSRRTPSETYRRMWAALKLGETWQGELINRHKDGRHYLQSATIAPLRDERGRVVQYISVQMDITAQRAAEERAELLVWFDPLTGLPNRQRLLSDLSALLQQKDHGQLHGLLLINIDRFKAVNEARGHALGDQVLQALTQRLRTTLQGGDMLAHFNGDEFALLVQNLHGDAPAASSELLRRAEIIHEAMLTPLMLGQEAVVMSVSIGVALLNPALDASAGDALRHADTALHRAKDAGGQQTAFFDAGMGRLVSERFAIEQDLRRGLDADELLLYLQPQVNAEGHTVSAEALVRWQHPDLGLVPPGLFIPVAEESGLIDSIGNWVLERVCQNLGALRQAGLQMPIAVNISPRQFHQPHFVRDVLALLGQHRAHPSDLIVEITEGVVLHEVDAVVRRMSELTRHGVRFSIDDFGTGYSSLSYLKKLPIHELKIDRSFVQDAPNDPSDAALVEAILSVASHLRLRVVAEGVETPEQAAFFSRHAGVLMQGYLYGRPEPEGDFMQRRFGLAAPLKP